jgi:integrase/recombinase XerD
MAGGEGMIEAIDRYLVMKRVAGFNLKNTAYLLRSFGRFAGGRGETHIRASTVIGWASKATSVAQRHTRYQTVYRFASFVQLEDEEHEMPPPNYFGYRLIRRGPHIYSAAEIERLVHAAQQLRPIGSLRPRTYATLISLLAATGLRISEALQLLISDVRPDGLLIRKTKFQKSRLVPLHPTAVAGLRYYLGQRQKLHAGGEHVFVSRNGNRLVYGTVQSVFRTLLTSARTRLITRATPSVARFSAHLCCPGAGIESDRSTSNRPTHGRIGDVLVFNSHAGSTERNCDGFCNIP